MNKIILIPLLSSALLIACKPTPRTAVENRKEHATQPAEPPTQADQAAAPTEPPAAAATVALLDVRTTRQDFNRLRPWEKANPSTGQFKGVYLGSGRVLTVARAAQAATYVELSLPDQSRTVPARVVKWDDDLGLALLSVEHPEDAAIFEGLTPHTVGDPLSLGDKAELWTMIRGLTPTHVGVEVESVDEDADESIPMLTLRAEKPLDMSAGLPILKEGSVVALVDSYDGRGQTVSCINAEFINRFLDESTTSGNGVPVLGMQFAQLDDPVFNKYLKLDSEQGGIYVSEVLPNGAAQGAGIRKGDVVTSIEGMPLDKLGRSKHPLYGPLSAAYIIRSLKPVGQQIKLGISRDGEMQTISVPLNRDAVEKGLLNLEKPGVPPRYIMWGGLLFQPLSATYLNALSESAGNNLPLPFLEVKERIPELLAAGRKEIVALTLVIPTPATLGYDALGFSVVEKVNGRAVHSFAEFAEMLDDPTGDGLVELSLNRPPYTIYLDRQTVEASNDVIRRRAIPRLRQMGEGETK